jgi:hypothetical protein
MLKNVPGHPSYMDEGALAGRRAINRFETVLDVRDKTIIVRMKR